MFDIKSVNCDRTTKTNRLLVEQELQTDQIRLHSMAMTLSSAGKAEWRGGLDEVCMLVGSPVRWIMLVELAQNGWLPVSYLAAKAGVKRPAASAHVKILKDAGVLETGMGRLYRLVAALHPEPGAEFLDLGPCRIRLRASSDAKGKHPGASSYQVS